MNLLVPERVPHGSPKEPSPHGIAHHSRPLADDLAQQGFGARAPGKHTVMGEAKTSVQRLAGPPASFTLGGREFPYHDPAFGCDFRRSMHSEDVIDRLLLGTPVDVSPPLEQLAAYEKWKQQEELRRERWDARIQAMTGLGKKAIRMESDTHAPATVCIASEEQLGFAALIS